MKSRWSRPTGVDGGARLPQLSWPGPPGRAPGLIEVPENERLRSDVVEVHESRCRPVVPSSSGPTTPIIVGDLLLEV